jgi:hypothetical protein
MGPGGDSFEHPQAEPPTCGISVNFLIRDEILGKMKLK